MTTAAPTAPWSTASTLIAGGAGPTPGSPAGTLRVDARVVRKLAAQAAREVDGVSLASIGPVGRALHYPVPVGTPAEQLAVELDLTVGIDYPRPVRLVAEGVAAHVGRRVEELTGRPVGRLSVHVANLGTGPAGGPARVR
ncbi:MAG: Asp23/Gls24 family envelope stress response protein [Acidimicrobiales bacterium]